MNKKSVSAGYDIMETNGETWIETGNVMRFEYTEEIRSIWENQSGDFPLFLAENPKLFAPVTPEQKKENELLVQEFSRKIKKRMQQKPRKKELEKQWELELEAELMDFMEREHVICLAQWIEEERLSVCKQAIRRFLERVRDFDATLKEAQIWQAMRNYFIYMMIVDMQGERQNARDPILAYSLLYPYTDNYIDDACILREEKERYNRMIARKLGGEEAAPANLLERKTCRLLDMILNSYEGMAKDRVAGVLLQLLNAQNNSIGQQKIQPTQRRILEISIDKGSTSVLADYLFSTADWREEEERFYLKFGFLLQLVDDLQDIGEDKKAGSHTLMTEAKGEKGLEACVNRLLWFSWNVIAAFKPRNPQLKNFVLKNCVGITLLAAVLNQQSFSGEYIKKLEPYLPFSADFVFRMKNSALQ